MNLKRNSMSLNACTIDVHLNLTGNLLVLQVRDINSDIQFSNPKLNSLHSYKEEQIAAVLDPPL